MNPAAKLSSALLIAAVLTPACGRDEPSAPTKIAAAPAENDAEVVAEGGVPKITADEAVYEFGAIKVTDVVEHVFKIRNAGDADLKIDRVQKT